MLIDLQINIRSNKSRSDLGSNPGPGRQMMHYLLVSLQVYTLQDYVSKQ